MNAKESIERKLEEACQYMKIFDLSASPTFKVSKEERDELVKGKLIWSTTQFKWALKGWNAPFSTIKEIE